MPPSAVYAAEDQWSAALDRGGPMDLFGSSMTLPVQLRFGDLDAIQRYVDSVMAANFVRTRFAGAPGVRVRERVGQRGAHYEPESGTIAIPIDSLWAARESVVLHELSHHLVCSRAPAPARGRNDWHGARFRETMCALVDAVMGAEAALLLRVGYESAGLRTVAVS